MKHYLLLVHLRTKFQLENSKLHKLDNLEQVYKKFKISKNLSSNRFLPNSMPKVIDRYIIFACSFRMMAQILRKLELLQTFFKNFKFSSRLWVIGVLKVENRTRKHTHTHTSGRQPNITFLDILDYSEYFDTNNTIFFYENSFLSEKAKSMNG